MKIPLIDSKKANDTGQALVLLCLVIFWFTSCRFWVTVGLIVLIVNMICPTAFKPAAVLWFGLAEVLGTVVSRIVLTLVFVLMVIPVGLLRYYAGSDPMRLKEWKQKKFPQTSQNSESVKVGGGGARYEDSVFIERNHQYSAQDIINPY